MFPAGARPLSALFSPESCGPSSRAVTARSVSSARVAPEGLSARCLSGAGHVGTAEIPDPPSHRPSRRSEPRISERAPGPRSSGSRPGRPAFIRGAASAAVRTQATLLPPPGSQVQTLKFKGRTAFGLLPRATGPGGSRDAGFPWRRRSWPGCGGLAGLLLLLPKPRGWARCLALPDEEASLSRGAGGEVPDLGLSFLPTVAFWSHSSTAFLIWVLHGCHFCYLL